MIETMIINHYINSMCARPYFFTKSIVNTEHFRFTIFSHYKCFWQLLQMLQYYTKLIKHGKKDQIKVSK